MANNVRAIVPFMDSAGDVWNPSVSIPADHPAVVRHPGHFIDADVSELELRERQGAVLAEAGIAAKQSCDAQLAEMERLQREDVERDQETAERLRREAYERAMHRYVADSRTSPMQVGAIHPDMARALMFAQALDARFARKDEGDAA